MEIYKQQIGNERFMDRREKILKVIDEIKLKINDFLLSLNVDVGIFWKNWVIQEGVSKVNFLEWLFIVINGMITTSDQMNDVTLMTIAQNIHYQIYSIIDDPLTDIREMQLNIRNLIIKLLSDFKKVKNL